MKKNIKLYILAWMAVLGLFNVISFVSVGWQDQEKYTHSFWIGYSLITVTFVGQLICGMIACSAKNAQKRFYNISLLSASYSGLILSLIVGSLCMLISSLPYQVSVIGCAIILVFNLLSVIKAAVVINEVARVDEKVKTQTMFIRMLTVDADTLVARAESKAIKAECKKVYEALRYSDPMSSDSLAGVEAQITLRFSDFESAVTENQPESVEKIAKELIILIEDRNRKCKLLK